MWRVACGVGSIYVSTILEQVVISHKSLTYSLGGANLFDFVIMYNGSKSCIGSITMTTCRALLWVGGLQQENGTVFCT